MFLLVLRGLALGMTVQTTMVSALSVVPNQDLARGSSLTNATRLVVQSIGVAVLATVLVSTLTAPVHCLPVARSTCRAGGCPGQPWGCVRCRPHRPVCSSRC